MQGDQTAVADAMYALMTELYPICRSITGEGVRQTLRILQRHIPLEMHEVPTGTPVFDWTVPKEWNIRDAYIKTPRGERVADFRKCNLHVVSYKKGYRWVNCESICSAYPIDRTGFRIVPLITTRHGVSA